MIWVEEKSDTLNSQVVIIDKIFSRKFPMRWDAYGSTCYSLSFYVTQLY